MSTPTAKRKTKNKPEAGYAELHQAIGQFVFWQENILAPTIRDVIDLEQSGALKSANGGRTLAHVFSCAIAFVSSQAALQIHEQWRLINAALKRHRLPQLDSSSQDYRDLDRWRDKIIARSLASQLNDPEHMVWFRQTYSTWEAIFGLLDRCAKQISSMAIRLAAAKMTSRIQITQEAQDLVHHPQFPPVEIKAIVEAVREKGLNEAGTPRASAIARATPVPLLLARQFPELLGRQGS